MTAIDTRHLSRDSLFVFGQLQLDRASEEHSVKVRNLSSGGMMASDGPTVQRGAKVRIKLRNIGWTDGIVAWIQGAHFGIAFAQEIDPKLVRAKEQKPGYEVPRYSRPSSALPAGRSPDPKSLRKI